MILSSFTDHWQSILDDSIIETLRTVTDIHDKAVLALRALCNQYYQLENGQPIPAKQGETKYCMFMMDRIFNNLVKKQNYGNSMGVHCIFMCAVYLCASVCTL